MGVMGGRHWPFQKGIDHYSAVLLCADIVFRRFAYRGAYTLLLAKIGAVLLSSA
jgi:hypothetical protein